MQFFPSLADWRPDNIPSAVTIGMFDGIHFGHQSLIRVLRERAASANLRTVVLTFDRHPRMVLAGQRSEGVLTTLDEKIALLEAMAVDCCSLIPIESGILGLEAPDFVQRFLVDRLNAKLIVVGYDFRFGHDRKGDFNLLRTMGATCGYTVIEAPPVMVDGSPVKSTRIRQCLREGNVAEAGILLGRLYRITGEVVAGDRVGRTLGFPTANVSIPSEKLLPAAGVYAGRAVIGAGVWPAAINLGVRPSLTRRTTHNNGCPDSENNLTLEAHLVGFSGDLYGSNLALDFGEWLRGEERFPGLELLKEQIQRDVIETERWFSEH